MESRRVVIRGPGVQGVGYRFFLTRGAMSNGVEWFRANNLPSSSGGLQAVEACVEGGERAVEAFVEFARNNWPETAEVEKVDVEEFDGALPFIDTYLQLFNVEQSKKFIGEAKKIKGTINSVEESINSIEENTKGVKETIEDQGEKTRETVRREGEKTRQVFEDHVTRDVEDLRREVRDLRELVEKESR